MQEPSQPTTTPARRRNTRGNGRAAAHKAYASENDAANVEIAHNPRTPQKPVVDPHAQYASNAKSTQRSRNKPRAASKNAPTSPESARPGRQTPPHPPTAMRSMAGTAFAGATFHSSPAPSALPIPSFMAKSSVDSPSVKPQREALQEPSPPTDIEVPTPSRQASAPIASESPLDFMFRAHREEQQRERRGSPASLGPSTVASDSPSIQSPFERHAAQKPSSVSQSARSRQKYQSDIDRAENGTPTRAVGPAFSTPYHERINAALNGNTTYPATAPPLPRQSSAPEPGEDPAEALKRYLLGGPSQTAGAPAPPSLPTFNSAPNDFSSPRTQGQQVRNSNNNNNNNLFSMSNANARPNDYREMEDSLRRLLGLNLAPEAPNTQRRLFS